MKKFLFHIVVCTIQFGVDGGIVEETREFQTFDASLQDLVRYFFMLFQSHCLRCLR